ncbi:lysophosphatidic acid receptor 6-like [Protopterus annectens]|uniref:lysophosphatidic acid receptor 6-like n=1 Tax=Protopterus annectens TaxID=7888 RepID=UPI001CFB83BE|nr:lysophosphatidic acid receptor 6-like [Protopterus annectens]
MMANISVCILQTGKQYRYILYTTVFTTVFFLGLTLNCAALWIFHKKFEIWTSTVIYMVNLAFSDLLLTISLPLRIYYFAFRKWPFGDVMCMIPATLFSINVFSSSFMITLISLDRYLAIVYPIRSRHLRSQKAARITCAMVWVFMLTVSFPLGLAHKTTMDKRNETHCFECHLQDTWKSAVNVLLGTSFVGFYVPFIVTLFCTVAAIRTLKNCKMDSDVVDKFKLIKLFAVNIIVFVICFGPFHSIIIPYAMEKAEILHSSQDFLSHAHIITLCLVSTNSCIDPVIYFFAISSSGVKSKMQKDVSDKKEIVQN